MKAERVLSELDEFAAYKVWCRMRFFWRDYEVLGCRGLNSSVFHRKSPPDSLHWDEIVARDPELIRLRLLGLWQIRPWGLELRAAHLLESHVWRIRFHEGSWLCEQHNRREKDTESLADSFEEAMQWVLLTAAAEGFFCFWPDLFPWQRVWIRQRGFVG